MKQVGHFNSVKGKIAFLIVLLSSLAVMGTSVGTPVTGKLQGDESDGYLSHSNFPSQGSLRASSSNYQNNVELNGVMKNRGLTSSDSCDYKCPSHSRRKRNRKCYNNFDDCYCYHGYYKKHGRCKKKDSSHSSDSSSSDSSSKSKKSKSSSSSDSKSKKSKSSSSSDSKSKKSGSSSSSDSSDSKSSDKSHSHKSSSKKSSYSSDSYSYDKHHSKKYHQN